MPPAKKPPADDSRSDASTVRERQIAAAAHARKSKQANNAAAAATARENGNALKELAFASAEAGNPVVEPGMAWSSASNELLNTYRIAHNLPSPPAFTTSLRQAILTMPGIGRQSPTMARKSDKRRVSKEQLATSVRKHFNGAAVSELDVVVELAYKVRHKDKAFRMRSAPSQPKKASS